MERFTEIGLSLHIRNDRRNPDGVETHVLDVVKLVDYTLVGTTAILAVFGVACWA